MSVIMVVASLKATNGIEDDAAQNSWVFQSVGADTPATAAAASMAVVDGFYQAIDALLSPTVSRVASPHTLTAYDITAEVETPGAGMGSPIGASTFSLGPPATNFGLPAEVAVCLSFHANLTNAAVEVGNTRPRSRRHGRVYLGPLCTGVASEASSTAPTRPAPTHRGTITAAATVLKNAVTCNWSIWSRADDVVREVIGGWVDDSFDTQRRRGCAPTLKSLF